MVWRFVLRFLFCPRGRWVIFAGAWVFNARLMRWCSCGTCLLSGLLALPLSGAGLTFFAAAKKVSKES
ncbi:hypothetical protein, partial [Caballeronia arationis]|uniref:hypothetical protein n=1 Tax=Caballeronia arationis TaxID=1777142 RepID=UPI0011981F7E